MIQCDVIKTEREREKGVRVIYFNKKIIINIYCGIKFKAAPFIQ